MQNYYNWIQSGRLPATAQDTSFNEEDHPRNEKGGMGGGRFRTSGKTIEKEDQIEPNDEANSGEPNISSSDARKNLTDAISNASKEDVSKLIVHILGSLALTDEDNFSRVKSLMRTGNDYALKDSWIDAMEWVLENKYKKRK